MRKARIEELFRSIHTLKRKLYPHQAGKHFQPLTPAQCMLLFLVAEHPKSTTTSIAKGLHITNGAVTQLVDTMIEKDYLSRTTDPNDRRAAHIALTPRASRQLQEIKQENLKRMTEVFAAFTDNELETYIALTKKLTEH